MEQRSGSIEPDAVQGERRHRVEQRPTGYLSWLKRLHRQTDVVKSPAVQGEQIEHRDHYQDGGDVQRTNKPGAAGRLGKCAECTVENRERPEVQRELREHAM